MRGVGDVAVRSVLPRVALPLLLVSGLAFPGLADDRLYYYAEKGSIVITNTPSRDDVRPVPGVEPAEPVPRTALPPTPYDAFIERIAREFSLAPKLVKAVAMAESGFDPHAVSPKGAGGLMQLMPATARRYGVRDVFDPLENLRAGARHLRELLDEFDGDVTLALAAYNAGSGAVRRHGGVPAYPETKAYVRKVRDAMGSPARRRRPPAEPKADDVRLLRGADGSVRLVN